MWHQSLWTSRTAESLNRSTPIQMWRSWHSHMKKKTWHNSSNVTWKRRRRRGRGGLTLSDCLIHCTLGSWITGNWHLTAHNHGSFLGFFSNRTLINTVAQGKCVCVLGWGGFHTHKFLASLWGLVTTKMLIKLKSNPKWDQPFEAFNHNGQSDEKQKIVESVSPILPLWGFSSVKLYYSPHMLKLNPSMPIISATKTYLMILNVLGWQTSPWPWLLILVDIEWHIKWVWLYSINVT